MTHDLLARAVSAATYRFCTEEELQTGIAAALDAAGFQYEREVRLSAADRIDFMAGGIGIEVKIDGSISALTRQLHRYAQVERVVALVVVTSLRRLANLPETMNGKPLRVVVLPRGIA